MNAVGKDVGPVGMLFEMTRNDNPRLYDDRGSAKCRPWRPMTRSTAASEFDVWRMVSTHSIVFTTSMTVPSRYSTRAAGLVVLSMGARAGA